MLADNTSLFSVVSDDPQSHGTMNKNLESITKRAHYWKIPFNSNSSKQVSEMFFFKKT